MDNDENHLAIVCGTGYKCINHRRETGASLTSTAAGECSNAATPSGNTRSRQGRRSHHSSSGKVLRDVNFTQFLAVSFGALPSGNIDGIGAVVFGLGGWSSNGSFQCGGSGGETNTHG